MFNLTSLTKGCLLALMDDSYNGEDPVLQVLATKRFTGAGDTERYRLLLSDGQFLQSFAMLSTHLNDMVQNGDLSEHSIIRVKQHITSAVNKNAGVEKRVLIIISLEVLHKGEEVGRKIGEPVLSESTHLAKINSDRVEQVPLRSVSFTAKISELEALIKQQRAEIDAKDAKITEQGAKIKELVDRIDEHGIKIEQLEASIAEVLSANST